MEVWFYRAFLRGWVGTFDSVVVFDRDSYIVMEIGPFSRLVIIEHESFRRGKRGPHLGASLFINGHNVASLNRPAVTAPHNNFPGIPQPLCFGLCGAKPGSGPSNLTVGNIAVAGANVATMAKNFLLGLLGLPMLNLLTPQATTSTPLKTTVATKVSSTTSHHGGFTLAPTSTPPATATAAVANVLIRRRVHAASSRYSFVY
ncbi:uncharacterized protein LOC132724014 [Ruditapes philippinarum]|uniref:uncharacterized protein LOC132724014 n=1 Tax=Ruditapes philippinarum TaxID=129788 RepID=UPI00295A6DA3|nr:uncharacterized protein LOC132724014 [Ruditapes philippinarum]